MSTRRSRAADEDPMAAAASEPTEAPSMDATVMEGLNAGVPAEEAAPAEDAAEAELSPEEAKHQQEAAMAASGAFALPDDEAALAAAQDPDTAPGTVDVEGEEHVAAQQAKAAEKAQQQAEERNQRRNEQSQAGA